MPSLFEDEYDDEYENEKRQELFFVTIDGEGQTLATSAVWPKCVTKSLWGRDVLARPSLALSLAIYLACILTCWVPPELVGTWISSPRFVLTIWNAAGELFSRTDLIWVLTGKVYPMVKLQPAGAETVVT